MFYRIEPRADGLVDVILTPGQTVPAYKRPVGRMEFGVHALAVRGVNPADPQWGGDLEAHVRAHYSEWILSAEEVEI